MERRTPLSRRTPLRSKTGLTSIVPLVRRTPLTSRPKGRARPEDPLASRCEARIDGVCTGQPAVRHHRLRRSQGGGDEAENTLDLCVADHDWLHRHVGWAVRHGLLASKGRLRAVVADCRPDCDAGHNDNTPRRLSG